MSMTYVTTLGILAAVTVLALVAWFVRRKPPLDLGGSEGRCGGCVHWDWQVGQQALRAHRPFSLVMSELQPWEVGQTHREYESNDEYEQVKAELLKALEVGDDDGIRALQSRLEVLNPRQLLEGGNKPPPEYRGLTWLDFGACALDEVVTARSDTCVKQVLITRDQLLRNTIAEQRARAAS